MSFMTVPSQREAAAYTERMGPAGRGPAAGRAQQGRKPSGVCRGARTCRRAGAHPAGCTASTAPGMDEETLGSQGYERISARIESYIPQSSVVGMLLHYLPAIRWSAPRRWASCSTTP